MRSFLKVYKVSGYFFGLCGATPVESGMEEH